MSDQQLQYHLSVIIVSIFTQGTFKPSGFIALRIAFLGMSFSITAIVVTTWYYSYCRRTRRYLAEENYRAAQSDVLNFAIVIYLLIIYLLINWKFIHNLYRTT